MEAKSGGLMSAKRHKSVIETNQLFGAGRVEPAIGKESTTRK